MTGIWLQRSVVAAVLLILARTPASGETVDLEWVRWDANGDPYGSMIAMDHQENVIVVGWRWLLDRYLVTKKYDARGALLWERHFSVPEREVVATWVTVDSADNVVVVGYPRTISSNPVEVGLLTVKYDSDGNLLWSDTYPGTWALAVRGITDDDDNIYVAGRAWFGTYDFVTIKYAPDGKRLWVDTFDQNSGFHTPTALDVDSQGRLVVTGGALGGGLITVLYDAAGNRQWVVEHPGSAGSSVELTQDGHIYWTGGLFDAPTGNDIQLLKYELSGASVWERKYDFGGNELGAKLVLDSQGNVVITGTQGLDWVTMKTDADGNVLWFREYDMGTPWDEYGTFMATGPEDEIYLTGTAGPCPPAGCSFRSMVTLRYDAEGSLVWATDYSATASLGLGLALAADGSVYVVGNSMLTLIKYTQSGAVLFADGFESGDTSAWSATVP